MAWWPFGRKRRKDKETRAAAIEQLAQENRQSRSQSLPVKSPQIIRRPEDAFPSKHHPAPSPLSTQWALHEKDSMASAPPTSAPRGQTGADEITALPRSREKERSPPDRRAVEPDSFRSATMPSKRSAIDQGFLFRRKSSKRRKDDHDREKELKAMSASMLVPGRHGEGTGSPSRRGSKRLHGGLDKNMQNLDSSVSLPTADSLRSSFTGFVTQQHYEVGSMGVLSPRPTIRYSLQQQYASGAKQSSAVLSRTASARSQGESRKGKRPALHDAVPEVKTIDHLADDLDAASLRALMERDQRRRERKRKSEEERARRRLERHAARSDTTKPRDGPRSRRRDLEERPVTQPEDLSLVVAGPSSPIRQIRQGKYMRRSPPQSPVQTGEEISRDPFADPQEGSIRPATSIQDEVAITPVKPFIDTAQGSRFSQVDMSPPSSPMQRDRHPFNSSHAVDLRSQSRQDASSTTGTDSERGGSDDKIRRHGPLAALIRRSLRGHRGSNNRVRPAPSEVSFSNNSRESMTRPPPPLSLREKPSIPRDGSATPVRTKSKFREDLPELPISPPDSRLQSPEPALPEIPPLLSTTPRDTVTETPQVISVDRINLRNDSLGSTAPPTSHLIPQSLASVDSEASWLSGKPSKRTSLQILGSPGSLTEHPESSVPGVPEGEDFRPLAGDDDDQASPGQIEPLPSESPDQIRSGEVGRLPSVVYHQPRIASHQGFRRQSSAETEDSTASAPFAAQESLDLGTPTGSFPGEASAEPSPVKERSYGIQHVRSISRGSAVLLDIPAKRMSRSASGTPSPGPETVNF